LLSVPPSGLTLVASDTVVRILDGTQEVLAQRRYDRQQLVPDIIAECL